VFIALLTNVAAAAAAAAASQFIIDTLSIIIKPLTILGFDTNSLSSPGFVGGRTFGEGREKSFHLFLMNENYKNKISVRDSER
jgi:hypothetical protein